MASTGTVRTFNADEGWGVLDAPDTPGGCWVHFSAIVAAGYRSLTAGDHVRFHAERGEQDGFAYRATKVWTGGTEPPDPVHDEPSSGAYQSSLTLTVDPDD
jgi:CspA family cold shock protein